MPHINFTGKLLDLKDPDITLFDIFYSEVLIEDVVHKVIHAKLNYKTIAGYSCGHVFVNNIIKHDTKS